jgi:hypothetical protein
VSRHTYVRMTLVVAATALLAVALPTLAAAAQQVFDPDPLVFPVVGEVEFEADFGEPRGEGRTHEGIDIIAIDGKGTPVLTIAAGTVSWIDSECCHLAVDHGGGWSSWYIHLDNDTPGTDDGAGWGIAPGIEEGTAVDAGELLGWVGDSGNAEGVEPHLHLEIRYEGVAVDPYPYLIEASGIADPGDVPDAGTFKDDDASVHQANIEIIADLGITKGCNPPVNDEFCPGRSLTRGQIAAFLRRHLELPPGVEDHYVDDDGSIFEDDINALSDAGIAFGCDEDRFCPAAPLRREEMAELLVRTFAGGDPEAYTTPESVDWFADDTDSPFVESIDRLRSAGVTVGCNPPDNDSFCPLEPLTRAQMATFLARALGLGG